MRKHGPAPLPFPGFFFEGAAIFTSAAENICNLWNEACKHGLKRKEAQTNTQHGLGTATRHSPGTSIHDAMTRRLH